MSFGGLVQELAQLREAAVQGLSSLQTEHVELEEEIRRAQERHQTVGAETRCSLQSAEGLVQVSSPAAERFQKIQFYCRCFTDPFRKQTSGEVS